MGAVPQTLVKIYNTLFLLFVWCHNCKDTYTITRAWTSFCYRSLGWTVGNHESSVEMTSLMNVAVLCHQSYSPNKMHLLSMFLFLAPNKVLFYLFSLFHIYHGSNSDCWFLSPSQPPKITYHTHLLWLCCSYTLYRLWHPAAWHKKIVGPLFPLSAALPSVLSHHMLLYKLKSAKGLT